ncbi:MAG TPA: translation elongation factor Ts [Candidatus Acidoferrum sp.]|nr:translation elongation factor Ts [Candidatus Acidoferrum sp.]
MEISAQMVKDLREKTGAGMMDCKHALAESKGDIEKAVAILREKGIARATSKEGRSTKEGIIWSHVHPSGKLGVMVEINCETDFVARTDKFRAFASDIANHVAASAPKNVDDLLAQAMKGKPVSEHLKEIIGSIGENMGIKRFTRFDDGGFVTTYVHPGDKLGVLVEITGPKEATAGQEKFKTFARDVAMQIAASSPVCVRREELDASLLASEREIYRKQALNEGKPEKIVDKIVDGKIEKYFSEVVLLEQPFVKDNDKSVGDLVKETAGALGETIVIKRFARFRLGE